ncbi:MAG: flagellar biosynthesis protein FlhB [Rubricoccaceae bacterium]
MSDKPQRDEKIHDPSPQRLLKAREEGNVHRSKELASVAILGVGGALLVLGAPAAFRALQVLTARVFLGAAEMPLTMQSVPALLRDVGVPALLLVLPFFGLVAVTAFGAQAVQSGVTLTLKPLEPRLDRVSPLAGARRLFSAKGLFEAAKAVGKALIVGPIAYLILKSRLPEMLGLQALPVQDILVFAGRWFVELSLPLLAALLVLAVLDYAFGRHRWFGDLKMTVKEVKDEAKSTEGDPHVRGRRRQLAREMALRPRLDHAVLRADVVVTNPTHYAVALRYAPEEAAAPVVLVKGIRKRALRIKALALEHGIPTVEDRPLARALYAAVEEGQPIAEDLFPAVAAVLAEVYRSRGLRRAA